MKKNFLIVTEMCALLVGVAPIASGSAAEVEQDVQEQTIQSDIGIAPSADEIVTKFRINKDKVQYRRWNQTRGYWVDKKWIDL